jgi:NAD(P)-dependent dehydrogenase (short-subunit alcohol dehydrogenase family)
MNNLFDIKGNVTVITGGTGVLGRAIAKYLALNGAKVVILGRKEDVGNQIAADIRAEGGECEFMKRDVLNVEVVRKNCEDILAKYGRVDTLLNSALLKYVVCDFRRDYFCKFGRYHNMITNENK